MNRQTSGIASLIDGLGLVAEDISLATIGIATDDVPEVRDLHAYEVLPGLDELPQSLRVQLGIVVASLDSNSQEETEQVLSRLRDVHCERVLLLDIAAEWSPAELRSLGYLETECPSIDGRCYLFDPNLFNQPREWNNPSDWANPGNFRKYRW